LQKGLVKPYKNNALRNGKKYLKTRQMGWGQLAAQKPTSLFI